MTDPDKIKRVLVLAENFELLSVDFLDANGEVAKHKKDFKQVRFGFSNGEEIMLSDVDAVLIKDTEFKLAKGHKTDH